MKVISDKIKMAIATALHSFDLLPSGTFDEMKEKLSDDAVIKRYRNDYVFHARVCSLTASVLSSVEDDIATLTRQRDLAVEAITRAIDMVGHPVNITYLQQTLDAIKESEGK